MPQRPPARLSPTLFRKSCLATAIAALTIVPSACSTMPRDGDVRHDDALVEAGIDRPDAGERNWNRMMYLLGFSEEAKRASRESAAIERARGGSPSVNPSSATSSPASTPLLDEVDWALMEEDAPMPESGASTGVVEAASLEGVAEDEEGVVVVASADEGTLSEETVGGEMLVDASELRTGSRALSHEVGDSETLWDIAKATTGDATNWHVLADVNDLEPNAAVYPGQILTIPADLVRPELTADAAVPATGTAASGSNDAPPAAEPLAAAALPGRDFELDADETLWDLARRTTGDATNWRAIAEANGFTEREASLVRPGQTITVPLELVRESLVEGATPAALESGSDALAKPAIAATDEAAVDASDTSGATVEAPNGSIAVTDAPIGDARAAEPGGDDDATIIRLPDVDATGPLEPIPGGSPSSEPVRTGSLPAAPPATRSPGPDALRANGDDGTGASGTLRIVDAAYRTDTPGKSPERDASRSSSDLPSRIMVSGTYYPKAVYNDADFSSSLLMRVSPGTTLQVSRAVGPWFEVETEQGRGYVHTRDIK